MACIDIRLVRLVVNCIWRCCGLGLMLVGAISTCTLVLLILLHFDANGDDKLPDEVVVILVGNMDDDILVFSLDLGLSTFRRDTDPKGLK